MLSLSNSLSFDMVSKTTVLHKTKKRKQNDIDTFINEYVKQNINQGDDTKRWIFVQDYTQNLPIHIVDRIIHKYGSEKITNDLIEYYFEIYKHMEFVFEKHINMFEKESDESIKRNMICLILFNAITYSNFLY